jgi:serine/arginine repetitive matrix protein 2
VFSIASVSSYGRVINPGSADPFDFAEARSPDVHQSEDDISISMSMTVDDTFSFIRRDTGRRRVDSDASSFYFRAPAPHPHMMQPYSRAHRRDSTFSVQSVAPPVSLHNRNFGVHRRSDSNTSVSSISYAMQGAPSGRAAWARHRHDTSVDSVTSDFSARRLSRPGLGDKMLESALDHCMPLTSISASPPDNSSKHHADRMSYDSILDEGRRSSTDYEDQKSCSGDSLFDNTGNGSSVSSGSVFGYDNSHPPQGNLLPPNQFRPVPMFSFASVHSPNKEDDTMISVSFFFFLIVFD